MSSTLVEGVTDAAGATVTGLEMDGLRIGRGIEMGVADFEATGAGWGDSETTAGADSGILGCSASADDAEGGGTDSMTSISCC